MGWRAIAVVLAVLAALALVARGERRAPRTSAPTTAEAPAVIAPAPPSATEELAVVAPAPLHDMGAIPDAFCDPAGARGQFPIPPVADAAREDPRVEAALERARAARRSGDEPAQRRALAEAHAQAPSDPGIAIRYAISAFRSPDFPAAAAALAGYLARHPGAVEISRLRSRLETQVSVQEGFDRIDRAGLTVAFPPELPRPAAWRLMDTLHASLDEAAALTGTPRRKELYAVVYRDRSELLAVTCAPAWARGVYDGTLRLIMEGEVKDDAYIRHEILHAQLGERPLPYWFHEGLAEYFEAPDGAWWRKSHALIADNRTYIPFASLVDAFAVLTENEDAALAYAESEAMIRMLIARDGPSAIARAIELAGSGTPPAELAAQLGLEERELVRFLERSRPAPRHR